MRSSKGKRTLALLFFLCALCAPSIGTSQPDPEVTEPEPEEASTEAKPATPAGSETSGEEDGEDGEDGSETSESGEGAPATTEPVKEPVAPTKTTTTEFEGDVVESSTPKPTAKPPETKPEKSAAAAPSSDSDLDSDSDSDKEKTVGDQLTTATDEEEEEAPSTEYGNITSTFTFGSYGRVRAATDFDGGSARQINVVSNGSRIDESNYAELEFQNLFEIPAAERQKYYTQVVATLALGDNLFHFTEIGRASGRERVSRHV